MNRLEDGLGLGELVCRWNAAPARPDKTGMDNQTLLTLAEKCHDKDMAQMLIDYSRVRDGDNKSEDLRIITKMVEKQIAQGDKHSEKEREANTKMLASLLDYLKARELAKTTGKGDLTTALVYNDGDTTPVSFDKRGQPTHSVVQPTENKDSLLSIPFSLGLIGLGLGASSCGVCCYRLKRRSDLTPQRI